MSWQPDMFTDPRLDTAHGSIFDVRIPNPNLLHLPLQLKALIPDLQPMTESLAGVWSGGGENSSWNGLSLQRL